MLNGHVYAVHTHGFTFVTYILYTYLVHDLANSYELHSGICSADFYIHSSRRSNWHLFYLVHILCSCTHLYECEYVLDGFLGDGCQSVTGSEIVPDFCEY